MLLTLLLRPVVFDVSYRPRITPLLEQAKAAGCETISGITMLIEQGLCQLNLWTMRAPPSTVVRKVTSEAYDEVMTKNMETFPDRIDRKRLDEAMSNTSAKQPEHGHSVAL